MQIKPSRATDNDHRERERGKEGVCTLLPIGESGNVIS